VIIGVDEWERFTLPLLQGLNEHEPEAQIICVDNGSSIPYPKHNQWVKRIDTTLCYAQALNEGIAHAGNQYNPDWFVVMNNDVIIKKPFIERIENLDPEKLYGFYLWNNVGFEYLSGWCYFISKRILLDVGLFDPEFRPMWYEDADYSKRVVDAGFKLEKLDRNDWGIIHLADTRTDERKDYAEAHMEAKNRNLAYLRSKHDR
jgi:GT2 family glycosyltransferase